jgi:ATP-dependent Lhr-like helicase
LKILVDDQKLPHPRCFVISPPNFYIRPLHRLEQRLDRKLQWAALSATIGQLSDVRDFLFGSEAEAVFLNYPVARPIDAHLRHIANEKVFLDLISKLTTGRSTKLLVFANSRRECERLANILRQEVGLHPFIFAHYSSLSQEVRVETEQKFAAAPTAVCVATSTLELGIDIGDIDAVILWGTPHSVESFLQRIGRGNRRSNKTNVICLIPDDSENIGHDALRFLALIDAAQKGQLPIRSPYELLGAVGQQCCSFIASDDGRFTRIADLCKLFEHKLYLDRPLVEIILGELAAKGYLQPHGFKNQYGADDKLHSLVDYRMIYGNFGTGSQTVEVYYRSKLLGAVPIINLIKLRFGSLVRFVGKSWRVNKVSLQGITLEPARQTRGNFVDFTYPGNWISSSDSFLADRMWNIIHSEILPSNVLTSDLLEKLTQTQVRLQTLCKIDQIPYVYSLQGVQYFTFAGYLVNKAIALITNQPEYTADNISLLVTSPINWKSVPIDPEAYELIFPLLFEASSDQSVFQKLLPTELQMHEFVQDWLKDQTVPKILTRLSNATPVRVASLDLNLRAI